MPAADPLIPSAGTASRLGASLLAWFDPDARPMPWRAARDPYAIWVSEVMLQQTQVATVIPYFERFMARFPRLSALAEAPEDDLLKLWEGLGYYSRARHLQQAARMLLADHAGVMPRDAAQLRTLPGVGAYTAGAIASIAFNQPEPAVDGNVFRVLSRLFACEDDVTLPATRRRFEGLARCLIPEGEAWRFNQALMELGATVCTPRPRCEACPWASECAARASGRTERFPVKGKRVKVRDVTYGVAVIADDRGGWLIERRPPKGLLGGLWAFPTIEAPSAAAWADAVRAHVLERFELALSTPEHVGMVPHAFTHQRARFHYLAARVAPGSGVPAERDDLRWVRPPDLEAFALPLAHRKIRDAIVGPALTRDGPPR